MCRSGHATCPRVWEEVSRADVVLHAGDWVEPALLDALAGRANEWWLAGATTAQNCAPAYPNVPRDPAGCASRSCTRPAPPTVARRGWRTGIPDTDVLVFGHSHIPWDTTKTGLRLLNPGSPTDRRRQPFCTYMTATVEGGELTDVVLHRIDRNA